MKKTPLYEIHAAEGAKMVDFHGWCMPLYYGTGILKEHENVRKKAGIFDVSHMGELLVEGSDADRYLQSMVTNEILSMEDGTCVYTPVCYPEGGTVDDILVYKISDKRYMLVVNASNTEKDFEWFLSHAKGDVRISDHSAGYAQLAVQGPLAEKILQGLAEQDLSAIGYYRFRQEVALGGMKTLLSRTGYTGEDGFEIYVDSEKAEQMWQRIMDAGKEDGLAPAGLGARDTLRLEAGMPLYGNELSKDISPVEAGLGRFISFEKGDFIGREALLEQKENPSGRRIMRFEMVERGVPRAGYRVQSGGKDIGYVTSGGYAPVLEKNIGMALIEHERVGPDDEIFVVIRDKPVKAEIIRKPFYRRKKG